jgi:hypothetical protein
MQLCRSVPSRQDPQALGAPAKLVAAYLLVLSSPDSTVLAAAARGAMITRRRSRAKVGRRIRNSAARGPYLPYSRMNHLPPRDAHRTRSRYTRRETTSEESALPQQAVATKQRPAFANCASSRCARF